MIADHYHPRINKYPEFPNASVLDVTLRDGSFAVGFHWREDEIRRIVDALARAGIPFIELGYYGGVPELHNVDDVGLTADMPLTLVQELSAEHPSTNFALMVHPGACQQEPDFTAMKRSGVSLVRFVYHHSWAGLLKRFLDSAQAAGVQTSINVALASRYEDSDLVSLCRELTQSNPTMLYLADTCSAFYPYQVESLYHKICPHVQTALGFHAHDFLSLAFANSLAAGAAGAAYVDVSLCGIGRGAGNLAAELWCTVAVAQQATGYDLEALLSGHDLVQQRTGSKLDMMAIVCGASNLTPPEEDMLRQVARMTGSSEAVLACRYVMHRTDLLQMAPEKLKALVQSELVGQSR